MKKYSYKKKYNEQKMAITIIIINYKSFCGKQIKISRLILILIWNSDQK